VERKEIEEIGVVRRAENREKVRGGLPGNEGEVKLHGSW
jgi:hypothetical protein